MGDVPGKFFGCEISGFLGVMMGLIFTVKCVAVFGGMHDHNSLCTCSSCNLCNLVNTHTHTHRRITEDKLSASQAEK